MESDTEMTLFSTENGSKRQRIGMQPDDLNQDLALDLPYIHPTLPVKTKKVNYKSRYTRRQIVSGGCLLFLIIGLIATFAMTIVFSEKYMFDDVNPTDSVTADLQSTPGQPNLLPATDTSGPSDSPQSGTTVSVTQASGDTDTTTVPVISTTGGLKSSQDISTGVTMPTTDTLLTPVTGSVPNNGPSLQDSTINSLSITKVTVSTTTDSMTSGSGSTSTTVTVPMVHPSSGISDPLHENH